MTPEEYLRRRATVCAYVNTGLLRSKLSMPSAYDLAEAVFLGMPKPYQEKYAEKNDEVSTDLVALKNAFAQYHAADVRNGALAKIIKERESRKRPHQPPTTKYDKKRRTGRRDGYRDDRGGHRDRRDRDYDRRDDRRNDRGGRGGYRGRDGYNNRGGDDRKGSGGNGDAKKPPYKNTAHHVDDNDDQQSKKFDADSIEFSNPTATTDELSCSDESVGNASIASEECFDVEEKPQFNYRGPKVLPTKNETPVTICTTNTIGMVKSRRLFRVLLDSGATCSLIKRSCLPKNCQTKAISSSKKVSTLAGKIKSQEENKPAKMSSV
eukprot:scaffold24043_cov57-Cyclotella_meneghiniana.AAC.1